MGTESLASSSSDRPSTRPYAGHVREHLIPYFEWADSHNLLTEALLVHQLLGLNSTKSASTNMTTLAAEFSHPEARSILNHWLDEPVVGALVRFADVASMDTAIQKRFPAVGHMGSTKRNRDEFKHPTQHTLLLLINPLHHSTDPDITSLRRQFRLWLTIQDAIRLVDHGYHGDQKLAPLIRSYVLGSEDGEKWAVIDSLLARTRIEATRFESSFHGFSFALKAAAEFQRRTATNHSGKFEMDFLHRVLAVAAGELHPPEATPGSIQTTAPNILARLRQQPILQWVMTPSNDDSPVEIPLAEPSSADTDAHDESDPLLLVPVEPRASHARKTLSANSVFLQTAAAANFLPWEWETPLPVERDALQQWINTTLSSTQMIDALGAAICWLACHTGRSLRLTLGFCIQDEPTAEWDISPDGRRLHKKVTRRQNAWRPDDTQRDLVTPFMDVLEFELPPPVTEALARAGLVGSAQYHSLQDAWVALADEQAVDAWFNQALPQPLQRLTGGKLMGFNALTVFERTGDHYLARIMSAHPRSGLPGACGYSAWDIRAIERGTDLTPTDSLRDAPADTHVLGSLLAAQEPLLVGAIEQANQVLRQPADSLAQAHNRIAIYVVTALYAATGSRYLSDPFEQPSWLDPERGLVFINDKSDDASHDGRIVPLPTGISALVKQYLTHLDQLAAGLANVRQRLASAIRGMLSGEVAELPLFFTLSEQLQWHSMSANEVPGADLFAWPLPNNLFRHRYAQQLQRLQVHPEVIDGWMGHSERHAHTWGDRSPRCWMDDVAQYRKAIERAFNALPFLAELPTTAIPDYSAVSDGISGDTPELWTRRLFGAEQRKRQRRIALNKAIKTARAEIDDVARQRPLSELGADEIQRLIGQMLSGKQQIGHHFAAVRLNVLRKQLEKDGGDHQYLLKRYPVPVLREPNPLKPSVIKSLGLLPRLQHWAQGITNTSTKTGRSDAAVLGGLLLAIQKRIGYERLLNDAMQGLNFRIVQHRRRNYLEYSEELEQDNLHAPVQRHEVSYQVASLLAWGRAGKSQPDPQTGGQNSVVLELKSVLELPADTEITTVVNAVATVVNQVNLITLPGMVAAVLSGRILSCALPMQDQIRLEGKKPVAIRAEANDGEDSGTTDPELFVLSGRYATADSDALKEHAKQFKRALQDCISRYTTSDARRIADEIQAITNQFEGKVSTAMLLLGHWICHVIRRGKGRGKRFQPLAKSSVSTYFGTLGMPFLELAFDVDLLSLDEDEITDLYRSMLEFKRIRDNQIGYLGDRLYSFHRVARKAGVTDPDWAELSLGDEQRRVRPGLITETDYLHSLTLIKQQYPENDQWLMLSFVLMACYRFGLRKNEACFLLHKDWCQNETQHWILVRNNRHRRLKNDGSRRALPLLFDLTRPETEIFDRVMARYDAIAGQDRNQPILCDLVREKIQPSPLMELISPALIRVIREVTGNPSLVLHHARHAFHNRMASVMLGIGTPAADKLMDGLDVEEIQRCVLGDQHDLSRRSSMALARLMGHQHVTTGMVSYNHLLLDWADRLVPAASLRTRIIPGALQTDVYEKYQPPVQNTLQSLSFEPPTLLNMLKMLRLVSVGRSFTQAGAALGLNPDVVVATETVFFNANRKMWFNKRGEDARIIGEDHPHALLHYINHDAWTRMLDKAAAVSADVLLEIECAPSLDALPSLVGRQRQLLMASPEHYPLVKAVLRMFEVDSQHYSVAAANDNEKITRQLTEQGFTVKPIDKASSANTRLIPDPFEIIEDGECIGIRSQYGVLMIHRNDQDCLRNSNELAVAFLSVGVCRYHCEIENLR